ncbi:hypothetical protein [Salinispora tropica]|uniref:hypothetical protein n=1 Tax=Salinispora tropica TaxID=168695 RepID=UPI000681CDAF|nr:hypothetical protein [Salinispora tropica]
MAEYLTRAEIRNYPISTGVAVDLERLVSSSPPNVGKSPGSVKDVAVGQVAYVHSMGAYRRGVITRVGRKLVTVTFTTRGAMIRGGDIRVTSKAAPLDEIRIAPSQSGVE